MPIENTPTVASGPTPTDRDFSDVTPVVHKTLPSAEIAAAVASSAGAAGQEDIVETGSGDGSSPELAGRDGAARFSAQAFDGLDEGLALYRMQARLGAPTIAQPARVGAQIAQVDAADGAQAAASTPALKVEKHIATKRGDVYTIEFDKPMTKEEASRALFHEGRIPTVWGARKQDNNHGYLVPVPGDAERATRWELLDPKGGIGYKSGGLTDSARQALLAGRSAQTSRIPDYVGPKTRAAVERGEFPPKPESGLDVRQRGDAHVWEEDGTLYWYKQGVGIRGAQLHPTNETYNSDMRQYVLEEGQDPYKAEDRFASEWDKIFRHTMGAYGVALAVVGGTEAAGDLRNAIRYSNRQGQ